MKSTILAALFGASVMLVAAPAFAQSGMSHGDHGAHGGADEARAAGSPAEKAYRDANAAMHAEMNVALTGDADADFLRQMIPHHQGAIDMARIVLEHGKDPAVKALAAGIVAAQEREIAEMKERLAAREQAGGAPK